MFAPIVATTAASSASSVLLRGAASALIMRAADLSQRPAAFSDCAHFSSLPLRMYGSIEFRTTLCSENHRVLLFESAALPVLSRKRTRERFECAVAQT